jgi:TonB dependent receptor/TonB-dependent Receptor Plug Domain
MTAAVPLPPQGGCSEIDIHVRRIRDSGILVRKIFNLHALPWTLALSIGLCVDAALAQADSVTELSPVTIRGHYDNAVGTSDAASQGVIRGEILQDIPLLRPGEALETVPGLVVTQHSGDGKANQYFLRGYNLDHGTDFATSIDGVPVNMPTNAHGQGYSDVNFMIPELVERINYRKGPYFAETGDFSSAGSADVQYRKRLDRNLADLTVGGDGYRRALLAGATALNASGPTLLGAVELQHSNGPWTTPEQLKKTNALLRLSDGSNASGWSVDGIHYDAKWYATDQVPLELIQSGRLGRFSALDPYDGGDTGRNIFSGEWHDVRDAGYTKASAYLEHYRLHLWSNFTLFENNPVKGDQVLQAETRNLVGGQAVKGWNHVLLGHDSVTELGLQLRRDVVDVGLWNTEAREVYATVTDDHVSETAAGLYLQNTTTWNSWLRTLVGLRADKVAMDKTSRVQPENSGTASGNRVSPKLSIILGPWAKTEFFVNVGKGFHSNDARGVIIKLDPSTGGPATSVPALVSSFGKEIGVRTEIIEGLQSSVALWSLNSDSELVYSSTDGTTEPNGASKRYGLEWNNHWAANRWLLFDADFAWTRARFANMDDNGASGNLIPNAVGKVALIRAAIHDLGAWSAGIETRYIGPYPLTQDGSLRAPAAIVTNLRIQRQISPAFTISLDALNVFNREYFDIAYGQDYQVSPTSPTVPSGITVHPGEPREFRLTLHIKF